MTVWREKNDVTVWVDVGLIFNKSRENMKYNLQWLRHDFTYVQAFSYKLINPKEFNEHTL